MRPLVAVAMLGGITASWCLVVPPTSGTDPALGIELIGMIVVLIWTAMFGRSVWSGRRLSRTLDDRSAAFDVGGLTCRIVFAGGRVAFALGALRPRVYLGDALVDELDGDELRAVLLHEEHHRRRRDPMRSAALRAWLALFGGLAPFRRALADRLIDLEEQADRDAVRHGADPSALCSALMKAEPAPAAAAGIGMQSDRRLRSLLALAEGREGQITRTLPYEWLPVSALAVLAIACHLTGVASVF